MPDLNNTDLVSFNGWTLRVRQSTYRFDRPEDASQREPSPRLLLLIHGLSGDENSMWVFARELSPGYWIVAPRAPHAATPSGYSWRPPQYDDLDQLDFDLLRASAEALIRLVDEYSASVGLDASTFDVMGFSQGGAMSNVLAFLYPGRIRKAGILAGFVPKGLDGLVSQRPLQGKPFFVAHGTKDQMVPIERARASVEILERAGADVTYCEDEVGHKVSVTCLHSLKKFLTDPAAWINHFSLER